MSHFPLPAGCRPVCRPNRSEPRRFTPAALTRIVRSLLADGYDEGQICEAVYLGGASCECVGAKKVSAYAGILMEDTPSSRIDDALKDVARIQGWLKAINSVRGIFDMLGFVDESVVRSVENVPLLGTALKLVGRITTELDYTLTGLEHFLNFLENFDTETQSLQKVIDFANAVCVRND